MRSHMDEACETIDAAIFSGDILYSDAERVALKEYVDRWNRAIAQHIASPPRTNMTQEIDPLFGWVYKQKGDPTIQDVRRAYAMLESVFGQHEAHIACSRFGCSDPIKLWTGSYRNFIEFAARCVEWKHPPSGGWTGDLPNHVAQLME